MKITLGWLRDHLNGDYTLETLCERLTALGHEVETVFDPKTRYSAFTIARVIQAVPHPNADRLQICQVETGQGDLVQVVCGAANARTGMVGVFAPPGSVIPGTALHLKAGTIRGAESNGMLCSERELELSDDHEGIIELDPSAPIGEPYISWAGLDDPVLDIAITPNRGDCLGVYGLARDLAASGLGQLKPLDQQPVEGDFASPIEWAITDKAAQSCPFVTGRFIRGVKNGPSPGWMQKRLQAIGLRPISILVDITNYLTYDIGRPLHVFDASTIRAGNLVMDQAQSGEAIRALDGHDYHLKPDMTVIRDGRNDGDNGAVLAIGGIIGGEASGCSEATQDVFLEAALFQPAQTAATGRRLDVLSDARYRFERGIDPASCLFGNAIATRMIMRYAGGTASTMTVAGQMPALARPITLTMARLHQLGGLKFAQKRAIQILSALECKVEAPDQHRIIAHPPAFRHDLSHDACLVEEIVRINGYHQIPSRSLPVYHLPQAAVTPAWQRLSLLRRTLAGRGLFETLSWSFCSLAEAEFFGEVTPELRLANPISQQFACMRPSLLIHLLAVLRRNETRGLTGAGLFETGPVFKDDGADRYQSMMAAGLRWVKPAQHWQGLDHVDLFTVKADALSALAALNVPVDRLGFAKASAAYHPGRSTALCLGTKPIAYAGELHPELCRMARIKKPVAAFEIMLDH
ncbi:MAG: phenylalanine--tRNA ligase subunit beta, partial [Pseudomonadota bacterium]